MKVINFIFFILIILFISFSTLSCSEKKTNDPQLSQKLEGCWVGGLLKNDKLTVDLELRLLTLKPDSSLALSLIYELGPRSRVYEYDREISCQNHTVSWLAHEGNLSKNLDTMYLTKNWKGEQTQWMFYRDKSYDDFIKKFISYKKNGYSYSIPASLNDNLYCASIEEVGFESSLITDFMQNIKTGDHGDIHSILVHRKGKLVLEEYFALEGKISGPFINETYRNKVHQLSSVTKGVLSLIVGTAIKQGNISNVNEPIYIYLPQYVNSFSTDKKQIQIKHLLTMTSGWEWKQFGVGWDDPRNNAAEMLRCNDIVKYVVERPLTAKPGKKFNYTNGEPTVLGVVLKNACEKEVDKFTDSLLFNPLGIAEYQWTRYSDGSLETDGGLKLKSRDLLKVGILMLNNGNWMGEQIITESWISESTKSSISLSMKRGHGYYWNNIEYDSRGKSENAIIISGSGGQFLAVFPSLDMVIVFTAGIYDKDPTKMYWKIITDDILPAVKE